MVTSPLHITNGDADAKRIGEILGEDTLPWRDFLHDGPVRPGLLLEELSLVRARFISGLGYGSYDSILVAFQNRDACFMDALLTHPKTCYVLFTRKSPNP
jgi:hypothetical protein